MVNLTETLTAKILEVLPEVDCVIAWGKGPDDLHTKPLFIRKPQDVEQLAMGAFMVHNPAVYLPDLKGKKVAVLVKGCDSRSVAALLQEGLIKREEVTIIGFPCTGVVSLDKIAAQVGDLAAVLEARMEADTLILTTAQGEKKLPREAVLAAKCTRCRYPNAVIVDHFVGQEIKATVSEDSYADVAEFEGMPLEQRLAFWRKEMDRCIRCYACRNACPFCVCRDHCVAQSRNPHWLTQADTVDDKMFFQVIHAMHLAGRCTECGECERACPVGLPILLLKRKLGTIMKETFSWESGLDQESKSPLLTFKMEEENIKERDW